MTAVHKPLACWVRAADRVGPAPDHTVRFQGRNRDGGAGRGAHGVRWAVRWAARGPVNDGDERADARTLPRFHTGWQRCALPLADGGHALALIEPATGAAVLEIDELGRPLPADPATAEVVAAIERRWPAHRLEPAEAALLRTADPGLRYGLLDRLADEGRPEPECFHVLPWDRVDRLAAQATAALLAAPRRGDDGPADPPVRLRHYLAPAGSRFTAALEQLHAALRVADPVTRRSATTALCERLAGADADRIPDTTRHRLVELLGAIGAADAFLHATAVLAVHRLTGRAPTPTGQAYGSGPAVAPARLRYGRPAAVQNWFVPAAADEPQTAEDEVVREAFTIALTVDSDRGLFVVVTAPLDTASERVLAGGYEEVLLLPIHVTGAEEGTDLYALLTADPDGLAGDLELTALADTEVTVDQSGPPLGLADLPFLDAAAVRTTLACLVRASDRWRWQDLLARLPAGHPVRVAAEGS
ncbi:hypothetical protein [Streptomyces vinaceus]|uniref:hypothetical protein n=1 Tax=Streptomyces vinaceus TaxID=1960 RepID=UPI0036C5F648